MMVVVTVATLVSLMMLTIGLFGLAFPNGLIAFVERWQSKSGLWWASGMRLVFGVALWFAAPVSHTPLVLRVLAVVTVVAGLVLPFLGVSRFTALLAWWCGQPRCVVRAWSAVAALLGMFILWSLVG